MVELKHPIREAERYLQNARQILSEKAEKDGKMPRVLLVEIKN